MGLNYGVTQVKAVLAFNDSKIKLRRPNRLRYVGSAELHHDLGVIETQEAFRPSKLQTAFW